MQQEERSSEAVEVDVEVVKQHGSAVLVTDGTSKAWVPYSQILAGSEVTQKSEPGFSGSIKLEEWKALALGLI
jgi:hypothetical protein